MASSNGEDDARLRAFVRFKVTMMRERQARQVMKRAWRCAMSVGAPAR